MKSQQDNNLDKLLYIQKFKENLRAFLTENHHRLSDDNKNWKIKGFIDIDKNIYSISTDTKVVSKILEIHILPLIFQFCNIYKFKVILAEKQNYYPDITLESLEEPMVLIAIDLKTTYRRNNETAGFTLGSHGGYFIERDKKKNIQFPYSKYLAHICLGIIYDKNENIELSEENSMHGIDRLKQIKSVITNLDFFVAEKWKIASDKRGSGNTANIGGGGTIDDLKNENGLFSKLGEDVFDDYWQNYDKIMHEGKRIRDLKSFLKYKNREDLIKLMK